LLYPGSLLHITPPGGEQIYFEIANYARVLGNARSNLIVAAYFTSVLQDEMRKSQLTSSPVFIVDPHMPTDIVSGLNNAGSSVSLTLDVYKATEYKLSYVFL
jgi:hypothetical protein